MWLVLLIVLGLVSPAWSVAPPSWVDDSICCWSLDESVGTRGALAGSQGGASCNLTPTNITNDTVDFRQGSASQDDTAGSTGWLGSNDGVLDLAADQTITAWVNWELPGGLYVNFAGVVGEAIFVTVSGITDGSVRFQVGNGVADIQANSSVNSVPLETWTHVAGRIREGMDIAVFTSGVLNDSTAFGDHAAGVLVDTELGRNGFVGKFDIVCVWAGALTDEGICRDCSCGPEGDECDCNPGMTEEYLDTGRNATECLSCVLPDCDTADAPFSGSTPTPTLTRTPTVTRTGTRTATPTRTDTPGNTVTPTFTAVAGTRPPGDPCLARRNAGGWPLSTTPREIAFFPDRADLILRNDRDSTGKAECGWAGDGQASPSTYHTLAPGESFRFIRFPDKRLYCRVPSGAAAVYHDQDSCQDVP